MTTKTLYEIEILCPQCGGRYKDISHSAGYCYRTCKLCGNTMAKKSWDSEVKEIENGKY